MMKLIEADKVEQAIKDYWKAQVDRLPIPKSIEEHDAYVNRLGTILEYNDGLLKAIDELPSAEPDTTTHDSIPAETGKNDDDGTSGDCISRQQAIDEAEKWFFNLKDKRTIGEVLKGLPSAQPETNCSEIPNSSDTISRQAVTKFLNDWLSCLFENCHKQSASDLKMIIKDFKNLPSAQSELEDKIREIGYTGKEGRIYIGGRLFAVRELPQ